MKIVVLAGGISTEREVSLVTGKGVCGALRKNGHKAVLLDVFFGYGEEGAFLEDIFEKESLLNDEVCGIDVTDPDIEEVKKLRKGDGGGLLGPNVLNICRMADIVFMALHGADGENGRLQAAFDILGIKYTGSGSFGSSLAMDKFISKKILKEGGIPVPYGFIVTKKEIKEGLGTRKMPKDGMFPCVVKPCCGGSSVGVSIAKDKEEYMQALNTALKYEDEILVEEYIKGRELSAGVVDGTAYPVIEIIPKQGFYDYKTKYQPGMADDVCPADISSSVCNQIQEYARKVYHMLKLEAYARIDFLLDANGSIYCLEANTLPGMTPTSLLPQEAGAVNISYGELCEKIVKASLEKYGA
ncbi:MAG: D-alanine--D-alanine ligase [Lachnospiraceae bacterium]|nr:D-alanine--D-alanine ligase [Lachnospiraceae bacterium]